MHSNRRNDPTDNCSSLWEKLEHEEKRIRDIFSSWSRRRMWTGAIIQQFISIGLIEEERELEIANDVAMQCICICSSSMSKNQERERSLLNRFHQSKQRKRSSFDRSISKLSASIIRCKSQTTTIGNDNSHFNVNVDQLSFSRKSILLKNFVDGWSTSNERLALL